MQSIPQCSWIPVIDFHPGDNKGKTGISETPVREPDIIQEVDPGILEVVQIDCVIDMTIAVQFIRADRVAANMLHF